MSRMVVQMGHVARTRGATGGPGEQAMARRVAAEIRDIAADLPDVTPALIGADAPQSHYRGDRFIAVHGDAAADSRARGASVGHRNAAGRRLGARWKTLYARAGWPGTFRNDNYTVALARYYGTGHAVSAGNGDAIIVEQGFMTNPTERRWIDSAQGTKIAACAALAAAYPQLDLQRLLDGAPEPDMTPGPGAPPSTAPSATVITVGDEGDDVQAWQEDLIALLGRDALPRWGADGDFGEETRRATVRAMRQLGLIAASADPDRPLVGPRTRTAMDEALRRGTEVWRGKAVVALQRVRFYAAPQWSDPYGHMNAGSRFPTIEALLHVGAGRQYRVRNGRGVGPFYVTASEQFVELR